MQRSQRRSHCWKQCLKSSMEMLSRAASNSCRTSAMSAKWLPFGSKHNGGCDPTYSPEISPCYFFCSQGWIWIWKGGILLTLQRFNENWWWPLTAFLLKILDNVSSSEGGAGIAAFSHRGSTLKGTKVSNWYDSSK